MKIIVLVLVFSAGVAQARGARDALFEAAAAGDAAAIAKILAKRPKLASAHKDGMSLVVLTGTRNDGEGFIGTRDNPPLRAVLARSPELDVFDAALVGDERRLAALLAADPTRATQVHAIGWRPLHFAAFGGKLAAVKLLLASGAELDARAKNRFNNTALQTALLCGEAETAKFLLDQGADVNARQDLGFVPLHEAAFLGRIDLIDLLLDHGAEINARTEKGESPVATAMRRGKAEAAAYLRSKGGKE
jgi:ankyrin repeat protein